MSEKNKEILAARAKIVDYLRKELIGPYDGENERLSDDPFRRYTTGIVFPQKANGELPYESGSDAESEINGVTGSIGDNPLSQMENQGDDPISMTNEYLPSSMGISFFVTGKPDVKIELSGGIYNGSLVDKSSSNRPNAKNKEYFRTPLHEKLTIRPNEKLLYEKQVFNEKARLFILWRSQKGGWLVTVSLTNLLVSDSDDPSPESCLHQVQLKCQPVEGGLIQEYPKNILFTEDLEERINNIIYRRNKVFGVGHGCSVTWETASENSATEVRSEYIPEVEVPYTIHTLLPGIEQNPNCLNLYYLSEGKTHKEEMIRNLFEFNENYKKWINCLPEENVDIPLELENEKKLIISKLDNASERISSGIRLLEKDDLVFEAFCLANKAMLLQRIHSTDKNYAGDQHEPGKSTYCLPNLADHTDISWRPFQLAFILLTICSAAFSDDIYRDTVDLLWFPTGGGKTEAYLAISAFVIFYRRFMYGSAGNGTTIIMRYTLRLLTTQQFQRASTLLCACDYIRRNDPRLGNEPISIGLWIGTDAIPNTNQEAYKKYETHKNGSRAKNPFLIENCPWCGTFIIPPEKKDWEYGIRCNENHFELFCLNPSCPFHNFLPVQVIDEDLYRNPPTLLLATVDKFARMPWEGKIRSFFGSESHRAPELIIQDELHLISGPLGTVVGIYETAIDGLCSWYGITPKILASTATIRRAEDQCLGLFERKVEMFPPTGLNANNSYFTRYEEGKPGRLYLGIMGQGHTPSTTMIRVSAALLQAPIDLGIEGDALDAYWTLIAYHNSLRELGKSLTFAADDIPARLVTIAKDEKNKRILNANNYDQLTSTTPDLNKMLERLKKTQNQHGALSYLVCTNMLSVGVDVSRLGLMLVNGQPKSTSEYIQASSRVGRFFPGLIITLLSATKPRDRSHYERFNAFHSSIYRFVEPTSVTPFSPPARKRALHAVFVSMVRIALGLIENDDAKLFSDDLLRIDDIRKFILERIEKSDPTELEDATEQLDEIIAEWKRRIKRDPELKFDSKGLQQQKPLLKSAGSTNKQSGWETLNSMRNVDRSCVVKILKR